jgi:hypothetical protein
MMVEFTLFGCTVFASEAKQSLWEIKYLNLFYSGGLLRLRWMADPRNDPEVI